MPSRNAGTRLCLGASSSFAPSLLRLSFELARRALLQELEQSQPGDVIAVLANARRHEVSAVRLHPEFGEPESVVIGRHEQAGLRLSRDPSLALRHALLIASTSADGGTLVRLLDLRTGQGLLCYDMERRASLLATRPLCTVLGSSVLFLVPGDLDPAALQVFGDAGWAEPQAFLPKEEPAEIMLPGHTPSDTLAAVLRFEPVSREPVNVDICLPRLRRGVLIGRYQRCDKLYGNIAVLDGVSRVHALLVSLDREPWLFDLASTNGIKNDQGDFVHAVRLSTTQPTCFRLAAVPLTFVPMAGAAK